MTRALSILLFCLLAICEMSCSTSRRLIRDVTVQNASTNHLNLVKVDWGGHDIEVGILSPGIGKTILDAGLPAGVSTNVAFIEFINEDAPGLDWNSGSKEEVRARRANSLTSVPVDVSPLLQLDNEPYQITFRILSVTNADVLVERIKSK